MLSVAVLGDYPADPERIVGGVQAVVRYLVEELSGYDDLDVHVITLLEGLSAPRVIRQGRLTAHYVPATYRFGNITFFALNKLRLLRELNAVRPDVVHAHIAGTYAEVAYLSRRPTVVTLHGIRHREIHLSQPDPISRWLRYPLMWREEISSVHNARHIISISPYIREEFNAHIRGKLYPLENPIKDSFFQLPNRAEPGRLLCVGHLHTRKSPHLAIEALARLTDAFPQAQLRLAGSASTDNPYLTLITTLIHRHGLEQRVHLLGQLDEIRLLEEYSRCAALVLPSRQETSPMVIQQAMAAGKAVVATRVGGIPYLVQDGQTGFLVEKDDAAGLADALQRLLSDDALRQRMGAAARAEAERRFRAADIARRTRDIYYAIANGASSYARDLRPR